MRTFRENEPLLQAITAPVLNEMARAVNRVGELDRVTLGGFGGEAFAKVVRVASATDRSAFTPVSFIVDPEWLVADRAFSAAESVSLPVKASDYSSTSSLWGLLLEPVAAGGVARAIVSGVATCRVLMLAPAHGFAIPTNNGMASTSTPTQTKIIGASPDAGVDGLSWATLYFAEAKPPATSIVAVVSGGSSLEGYSVKCYPDFPDTTTSFSGVVGVVEIALGTEIPVGTWLVVHNAAVEQIGGGA